MPVKPELKPPRIAEDPGTGEGLEIGDTRKAKLPPFPSALATSNQVLNRALKQLKKAHGDHLDFEEKNRKICSKPFCDLSSDDEIL